MLGMNHIQIGHIFLGRACAEMEIKEYENAEISAKYALKIVEANARGNKDSNIYLNKDFNEGYSLKNAVKKQIKSNLLGNENVDKSLQGMKNSSVQQLNNYSVQFLEMKCSILYILGQSLIEQQRLMEAHQLFSSALIYAAQLNDHSKQLLIQEQLRDIQYIINGSKQSTNQNS